MWLFSELGFYSINRTPDGLDLQFRARREQDLENLKAKFPQYFVGRDIMELPAADYRWRLETTDVYAGAIMAQMTTGISYRNFKKHLEGTDQADKLGILHDLWHMMHEYQQEQRLAGSHFQPEERMRPTRLARQEGARELFPDYLDQAQPDAAPWPGEDEDPAPFNYEVPANDGGPPFIFYEQGTDERHVMRDGYIIGDGDSLLHAWNNYLFNVSQAPIDDDKLAAMWTAYDLWRGHPTPEAGEDDDE